jgi:hypothetical protein
MQDNDATSTLYIVDPIPRAIINLQFDDSRADTPCLSGIPSGEAFGALNDSGLRTAVPEGTDPGVELSCSDELNGVHLN